MDQFEASTSTQGDQIGESSRLNFDNLLAYAAKCGLMGTKDRPMGGLFPSALIEAAQTASGLTEPTELLTYALAKVAFEDHYGAKLLSLEGTVPAGTFFEN